MAQTNNLSQLYLQLMHGLTARALRFSRPETDFKAAPEPRSIGSYARGKQLCAGNLMFAGHLVEAPGKAPWDIPVREQEFLDEVHGFGWLDDLAAVGTPTAGKLAEAWTTDWIRRYGGGRGAGWVPDLTGRRLIRWVHHGLMLVQGKSPKARDEFFLTLGRQAMFLGRRWSKAAPGLPRFEALSGLIYAGLSLKNMQHYVAPATSALARECRTQIDASGGILTRNPEELLEVFTLLTWTAAALRDADWTPAPAHLEAIDRIAPTLRSLRHSDGSLARFHGGGRGIEGRLDHALVQSGNKTVESNALAMGYARLSAGRTSVVIDAARPPFGRTSINAHASSLAFELCSGRRPLIVNCGSGVSFGADWRRAGRATPSHSTLYIDGLSSARLGRTLSYGGHAREALTDGPTELLCEISQMGDKIRFEGGHNGYVALNGLTHVRKLDLSADGRSLIAEDILMAIDDKDKRVFSKAFEASELAGLGYQVRLHLHPDVDPQIDLGGRAVSLTLKSGEIWLLRFDSTCQMQLENSVYLETGRLHPRATKQIVLSQRAIEYASRISWSLSKAYDTAVAVRDVHLDVTAAG